MTDERRSLAARLGALALTCYVPLLLTSPGKVAADTKSYLYLDPARLLARAAYLWDQNTAFGTVTHQNIGYLWPMGPWFWLFDKLGAPDWVAQRLWMGTLLFVAGTGIVYLGRTIGPKAPWAWTAAGFAYLLSPYVLDYIARISVLLLPWAALPWMVALTELSLRRRRWREPAIFALVVATAGGINATALVFAGLGPVLWVAFSVWVHRTTAWRAALATVLRLGVLTVLTNVWWIGGLAVQSGWGLDVLRYTETVQTVARSSLASEVLRGLGYWFFYGIDKLGPWIEPGRTFTEQPWLIVVGFVLPVAALAAAVVVRWRYRAYAVAITVLGTAVAVGAYPYRSPSPIGALFKRWATSSTAGLALRSTGRAVPLVVLGLVMLLAAGLAATMRRRPWLAGAVILVALAANPALWTGQFVASNLRHPEEVPQYWKDATRALDAKGDATRVLEIPGSDFATYRWGNEVDPITPGLMDRPYAARELVPFGTEPSANLLIALDRRIQEGVLEPQALAPVARLMGAGDVVVRGDLEYERYRTARPSQVWSMLTPVPTGLAAPTPFGAPRENAATPKLPMKDEVYLQTRATAVEPPVAAFAVPDPLPIVRLRSNGKPVLLEGDGEGVVDAAAAGYLGGSNVVVSYPALASRPDLQASLLKSGTYVVTDTNRKRAQRWGTVRNNAGYTERADEQPLSVDPSDNRLPLFPDAGVADQTTVEQRGVKRIEATRYGNPVSYTPADRPANAFDGDPSTAWAVGALGPVGGEKLLVEMLTPVTTDYVDVVQADLGPRRITKLGVVLDGHQVTTADVGVGSNRIDLRGNRTFRTLELVIEGDSVGRKPSYADQNGVGISEVSLPGGRVDEWVKLPTALLSHAGEGGPVTILLTRLRANPQEPFAQDEEPELKRTFTLPRPMTFTLTADTAVHANTPDRLLDALLGGRDALVEASARLAGDVAARASAAVDGDAGTAWTNIFGEQRGAWVQVTYAAPVTVDRLDLRAVDDGNHSVPTRVTVSNESGERRSVAVGESFPPLTGQRLRVTIDDVRDVRTTDWFSKKPVAMPVAIAELGLPVPPPKAATLGGCDATVLLDGRSVSACGDQTVVLDAGPHDLRTLPGAVTGIDVNRVVLSTQPTTPPPAADPSGTVTVTKKGRTSFDLTVAASGPTWLVLGQSWTRGWKATANGKDLGPAVLVDGYANGWLVDPQGGALTVQLRWTPQKIVWAGLAVSVFGAVLCLLIIALSVLGGRRRPLGTSASPHSLVLLHERPELAGPPVQWTRAVVLAVVLGAGAGLLVHPLVGVATVAVALVALRWTHGRLVGALGVALLVAAALDTAVEEGRLGLQADFGWTDYFYPAHILGWSALVAIVVLLVVDGVRRRGTP